MTKTRSTSYDERGEIEGNKEASTKGYETNASSNESVNTMLSEIFREMKENALLMNAMNIKFDTKFEENTSLMNSKFEQNDSLFENKMNTKFEQNTSLFESKLQQLSSNKTIELHNHAKHIDNQHDAHINEMKVTMDDLRDEICIVQSDHDKKLKNINLK